MSEISCHHDHFFATMISYVFSKMLLSDKADHSCNNTVLHNQIRRKLIKLEGTFDSVLKQCMHHLAN